MGGISDDKQRLCFALALWNGKDPILKEHLFGLTNGEGSHGEDVKEYHFYVDSTPTHSYMKFLYKYPQAAFPYTDLTETNRRRTRDEFEYERLDTGVFDEDRSHHLRQTSFSRSPWVDRGPPWRSGVLYPRRPRAARLGRLTIDRRVSRNAKTALRASSCNLKYPSS